MNFSLIGRGGSDGCKVPMKIETFTMSFDDLTNNSVMIGMMWENTYAAFPIETPTDFMVSKQIKSKMSGYLKELGF